jgi:[NiFe] hydrogenase diaphorase moiety small subunit
MSEEQSFTLDGRRVPFQDGQTLMTAALAAGVYIPHLCFNREFAPHGSCRVCLVKVNGRMQAACTTPAAAGQTVESETGEIREIRRGILQMLFVEGNHVCPACEKSGACQLQAVAYYVGMLAPHYTHFYPRRPVDASHPEAVITSTAVSCASCACGPAATWTARTCSRCRGAALRRILW